MLPEAEAMMTDEEFAALEADLARREARDLSARANEILAARETVVTKSAPARQREQPMTMNDQFVSALRAEWKAADEGWLRAATSAVGEVLREERKRAAEELTKMRAEFELEIAKLRAEFLQSELDRERGTKQRLKAVPSGPASLIA
jgi:Skp family chaperone for outer membrane proteins